MLVRGTGCRTALHGERAVELLLIIIVLVEWNALAVAPGKPTTKPLGTVKGTLWFGFILSAVFYLLFEVMKKSG